MAKSSTNYPTLRKTFLIKKKFKEMRLIVIKKRVSILFKKNSYTKPRLNNRFIINSFNKG